MLSALSAIKFSSESNDLKFSVANYISQTKPSKMAGLQDGREDARRPFPSSRNKKSTAPITATSRLKNDYLRLIKDPVPYIIAEPLTSNILEWHYVVTGPKDSPYVGGYYHGKVSNYLLTFIILV